MAKKKDVHQNISQEENDSAQQLLEHYHSIAQQLHKATDNEQSETALADINTLSENAQTVFVKALAKEQHTDAADVLVALYELSSLKSIRKEARRSLIRLEGARIYPTWSLPKKSQPLVTQSFAMQSVEEDSLSYRFWKGFATDSLIIGEAQLTLCFEQENDPNTVRVLGFLLEFFHDGVKDFFTRVESKRNFEKFASRMSTSMPGIGVKEYSLAEGRQLILDALAVNKRYSTKPHSDYRLNLSLVNRLVLDASNE